MALRKLIALDALGFAEEIAPSDTTTLGGLTMTNASSNPTAIPVGGGTLFADAVSGALKYISPAGITTTLAP